jgi:hypothetical protein
MKKRPISSAERYAVWLHHEKRCWLCLEPLRLEETTIDHFLPESLLHRPEQLATICAQWGLPKNFNINGFENWLPSHQHCNQKKGATNFKFTPAHGLIVAKLLRRAPQVRKTASAIGADINRDKLIGSILAALEKRTIDVGDLQKFSLEQPAETNMIHLDNGYWLHKDDVARECDCRCERKNCVDNIGKVHCYFSSALSDWVIQAGLYWKCYDEIIPCPRCGRSHKRGHSGRVLICGRPFSDPIRHTDEP